MTENTADSKTDKKKKKGLCTVDPLCMILLQNNKDLSFCVLQRKRVCISVKLKTIY